MNRSTLVVLAVIFMPLVWSAEAKGDIVRLTPMGSGGIGLLGTNISPAPASFGSGGVGPSGITLNTDTNILHIDIQWGSANGFLDLTSVVERLHLHGPTPDGGSSSFGQRGNLLINLANSLNFNNSPTAGGLTENFFVSNEEEAWILAGRTYINVHTTNNLDSGEIRGYLIAVPEPGARGLWFLLGIVAVIVVRNRATRDREAFCA